MRAQDRKRDRADFSHRCTAAWRCGSGSFCQGEIPWDRLSGADFLDRLFHDAFVLNAAADWPADQVAEILRVALVGGKSGQFVPVGAALNRTVVVLAIFAEAEGDLEIVDG